MPAAISPVSPRHRSEIPGKGGLGRALTLVTEGAPLARSTARDVVGAQLDPRDLVVPTKAKLYVAGGVVSFALIAAAAKTPFAGATLPLYLGGPLSLMLGLINTSASNLPFTRIDERVQSIFGQMQNMDDVTRVAMGSLVDTCLEAVRTAPNGYGQWDDASLPERVRTFADEAAGRLSAQGKKGAAQEATALGELVAQFHLLPADGSESRLERTRELLKSLPAGTQARELVGVLLGRVDFLPVAEEVRSVLRAELEQVARAQASGSGKEH